MKSLPIFPSITLALSVRTNAFVPFRFQCNTSPFRQGVILQSTSSSQTPLDASVSAEATTPPPRDTRPLIEPSVEAKELKDSLFALSAKTDRGFSASREEQNKARDILFRLAKYNPTKEPAYPYYEVSNNERNAAMDTLATESSPSTLQGKWTLVFTDAPDITSLGNSQVFAKLGRIGQDCTPPYIKNVIEWKQPGWAASFPLAGNDNSRILQKVVTKASATPDRPSVVNLELAGLEVSGGSGTETATATNISDSIRANGLVAALAESLPIALQGPLTAPFGEFEVLYLDDELRVIKTGQNYVAANVRLSEDEVWF